MEPTPLIFGPAIRQLPARDLQSQAQLRSLPHIRAGGSGRFATREIREAILSYDEKLDQLDETARKEFIAVDGMHPHELLAFAGSRRIDFILQSIDATDLREKIRVTLHPIKKYTSTHPKLKQVPKPTPPTTQIRILHQ